MNGLNIHDGKLTYKAVADALKLKFTPAQQALGLVTRSASRQLTKT